MQQGEGLGEVLRDAFTSETPVNVLLVHSRAREGMEDPRT